MKKISFLIIAILCSMSCMAQQIALSDTVSVTFPNGTEKLNRDQYSLHVNSKFKHSNYALYKPNPSERTDNKNFFKVDNVLIELTHGKRPVKNRETYLLSQKKWFDSMYLSDDEYKNYISTIKTFNNNQVLVINYTLENVGYYRFFCNDSTNSKALNGLVKFDRADANEASGLLDKLLNSVKFK